MSPSGTGLFGFRSKREERSSSASRGISWRTWVFLGVSSGLTLQFQLEPTAGLHWLVPGLTLLSLLLNGLKVRYQHVVLVFATIGAPFLLWQPLTAMLAISLWAFLSIGSANRSMTFGARLLLWLVTLGLVMGARARGWIDGYAAMIMGGMLLFRAPALWMSKPSESSLIPSVRKHSLFLLPFPAASMPIFPAMQPGHTLSPKISKSLIDRGAKRILEGILLLLSYRVIYSVIHVPASEVDGPWSLGIHLVSNALLLIRLAGFVRLGYGSLNLLGYTVALPSPEMVLRTGGIRGSLLATNGPLVRWLDHMVYRPLMMKGAAILHGSQSSLSLTATAGSAAVALILHALFWFLRFGHLQLRWVDMIFWAVLAAIYAWERRPARRIPSPAGRSGAQWISSILLALTTATGVFLLSLVASHSAKSWLELLKAGTQGVQDFSIVFVSLFVVAWAAWTTLKLPPARYSASTVGALRWVGLLLFMAFGVPCIQNRVLDFEPRLIYLAKPGPNRSDSIAMAGGYYAEIMDARAHYAKDNTEQLEIKEKFAYTPGAEKVADFRRISQRKRFTFVFKGHPYTTNSLGFRDQEYPTVPPPQSVRTLLLGSSFVAGSGVRDSEVFDVSLETRMNAQDADTPYEFLNASCSIYDLIDCIVRLDADSLMRLQPDYLIYFSHGLDIPKNVRDVVEAKRAGLEMPYPFIDTLIRKAGLTDSMTDGEALRRLRPYGEELVRESYRLLAEKCRAHNVQPIWVYWPCMIMLEGYQEDYEKSLRIVYSLGYEVVDLSKVYQGFDPSDLIVAPNDHHPNALGHRLVARALEDHFTHRSPLTNRR